MKIRILCCHFEWQKWRQSKERKQFVSYFLTRARNNLRFYLECTRSQQEAKWISLPAGHVDTVSLQIASLYLCSIDRGLCCHSKWQRSIRNSIHYSFYVWYFIRSICAIEFIHNYIWQRSCCVGICTCTYQYKQGIKRSTWSLILLRNYLSCIKRMHNLYIIKYAQY